MDSDLTKALTALGGLLVISFIAILLALPAPRAEAAETYTGTGDGYYAPITVEVGISEGKIVSIRVTEHEDTPGLADSAIDTTIQRIIDAQNTDVDAVSGATFTSFGVMDAVDEALAKAGL